MRKLGVGAVIACLMVYTLFLNFSEIPKMRRLIDKQKVEDKKLTQKFERLSEQNSTLEVRHRTYVQIMGKTNSAQKDTIDKLNKELKEQKNEIQKLKSQLKKDKTSKASGDKLDGFQVTYYNDYGHTKSGRLVKDGVTAAVDPSIIPLGSWFQLRMPDGTVLTRRADDTGSAVKGRIIDVYMPKSNVQLRQLGRVRNVSVALLN